MEALERPVEFLGLRVTTGGVGPLPNQLAADFPQPNTVKELRAFLGAFNFYCHFIPQQSRSSSPSPLSSKAASKWPSCGQSVWSSPQTPVNSPWPPTLQRLMLELSFSRKRGQLQIGGPLGSSQPNSRQPRCCTAPLIWSYMESSQGIRHFCHHLVGRAFTVWTDHKPLTFAL